MKLACNNLQIDSWVAFASPEKVIPDEDVIEARLWKDVPEWALGKKRVDIRGRMSRWHGGKYEYRRTKCENSKSRSGKFISSDKAFLA